MRVKSGAVCFAESMHRADFRMEERSDLFHKVIYVLDGRVAYREKGQRERGLAGKGCSLIVPSGVWHSLRDQRPSTLLVLGMDGRFIQADADLVVLWRKLGEGPGSVMVSGPVERRRLEALWRRALLEMRGNRPGSDCVLKAIAIEILVLLERGDRGPGGGSPDERVTAVAQEVEGSFSDPWSLDAAAAKAGMSRRSFSARYRRLFGVTFLDRLTAMRVDHAARLLESGEATVLGAMFASGFNDLSHFYRVFRARRGKPPGRWSREGAVTT
jgi:AraC-like DNA-binding protein